MSLPLVIYGATGHSGALVARQACALGLQPLLAGRDARKLSTLANGLQTATQVAALDDPTALQNAFAGATVVLNAAGPFSRTTQPVLDACLAVGAHYLDLSGEVRTIDALARYASKLGPIDTMIMPAVGYEVVASDCLAAHVAKRLPDATILRLATTPAAWASRGSMRTLGEATRSSLIRVNGRLEEVGLGQPRHTFDFGHGTSPALGLALADLVTAYYTTGIPTIETYVEATPLVRALVASTRGLGWLWRSAPGEAWLETIADLLPEDPSEGHDVSQMQMTLAAEAADAGGRVVRARCTTPEAYTFTALAAVAAVERVLAGDVEPGFQTPARVWGADFALTLPGVSREDMPDERA
jgi:short subunit dehydrogenase-like uncharacterized protein